MPSRRTLTMALALMAGGVLLGFLAAGGAAGPTAARPQPAAHPVQVSSRPATRAEAAEAGLAQAVLKASSRRQMVKTRISSRAVRTDSETGDFIGLTCPRGFTALSGGAVTGFTDLVISHSSPLKPTGGHRYTPRTWWVAVTNIPVDGNKQRLPWYPVVNCVNRLKVGT